MLLNDYWSRMILGLRANNLQYFSIGEYRDPILDLHNQGYSLAPAFDAEEVKHSWPTRINGKCSLVTAKQVGVDVEYDVASVCIGNIEWGSGAVYILNSRFAECAKALQRDIDHEKGMVKIHNVSQ